MKTITLFIMTIALLTSVSSCKKDPIPGPKGEQGEQGPVGQAGPQGPVGNANVQNYDLTISASQWTYSSLYEMHYYRYSSSVNSNSAIYGYVMSGSGRQAMPYYTCPSWKCEQFDMATNLFQSPPYIEFQYTNYSSKTTAPTSDKYFYIVIVPPAQLLANPDLDWSNYEAVQTAFNLGQPIKIESSDKIQ